MSDYIVTVDNRKINVVTCKGGAVWLMVTEPDGRSYRDLRMTRANAMRLAETIFDAVQASDTSAAVTARRSKKMETDDV